jgi:hypothetical protein
MKDLNSLDVDECLDDPCHQNATCDNTFGSFDCDCNEEFVGDGFNCEGELYSRIGLSA